MECWHATHTCTHCHTVMPSPTWQLLSPELSLDGSRLGYLFTLQPSLAHVPPHRLSPDSLNDHPWQRGLSATATFYSNLYSLGKQTNLHLRKSDPVGKNPRSTRLGVCSRRMNRSPSMDGVRNNQPGLKQLTDPLGYGTKSGAQGRVLLWRCGTFNNGGNQVTLAEIM